MEQDLLPLVKKGSFMDELRLNRAEKHIVALFFLLFYLLASVNLFAQTIGNVSSIVGVRDNQLMGYGLVVGLKGTGDSSSKFTYQTLSNLLKNVNVKLDLKDVKSKNVAAVIVTATLPPFARQGDKLDITVSSVADAKSLEGGTLLLTPLKGVDGQIYALAQGYLSIGGFNIGQNRGVQSHHTTVAKILKGAYVEREVSYDLYNKQYATLSLEKSDFNLAVNTESAINKHFKKEVARAIDPRTISLKKPEEISMVSFLARIEKLPIKTKRIDSIVIDERTGTIVAGSDIKLDPIVVTQGDMVIKIKEESTVMDLAGIFQKYHAKPKDIIAILETLKASGALKADVIIN